MPRKQKMTVSDAPEVSPCPEPQLHWEKPPLQLTRHTCANLSCYIDHISTTGLLNICHTLFNLVENQCLGWEHLKIRDVLNNVATLQEPREKLMKEIANRPEIYRFNLKVMLGLYPDIPNIPAQEHITSTLYPKAHDGDIKAK